MKSKPRSTSPSLLTNWAPNFFTKPCFSRIGERPSRSKRSRFSGNSLPDPDGSEAVGHQVYPLLDTESTTEPVPVYKPEEDAGARKTEAVPEAESAAAAAPSPAPSQGAKKKWWPF